MTTFGRHRVAGMTQPWHKGSDSHLIPLHGVLEGLHGKVHLLDVLVLHKDAQVHFAAGHGGEGVLAVGQVSSHQGKQVARLLEGVLPDSKMPALHSLTVQELLSIPKRPQPYCSGSFQF